MYDYLIQIFYNREKLKAGLTFGVKATVMYHPSYSHQI